MRAAVRIAERCLSGAGSSVSQAPNRPGNPSRNTCHIDRLRALVKRLNP